MLRAVIDGRPNLVFWCERIGFFGMGTWLVIARIDAWLACGGSLLFLLLSVGASFSSRNIFVSFVVCFCSLCTRVNVFYCSTFV